MARYALKLPETLKNDAKKFAAIQGVSLNQFIMWSVAEKVGALQQALNDPEFPNIMYVRGASGIPTAVIRSTRIRVATIMIAASLWNHTTDQIAADYELPVSHVKEALKFYAKHKLEIDSNLNIEERLEKIDVDTPIAS